MKIVHTRQDSLYRGYLRFALHLRDWRMPWQSKRGTRLSLPAQVRNALNAAALPDSKPCPDA
ncbi:hypothetical protein EGU77_23595 [Pseudomonas syringae pv. theae]|nr:hypothetical protein [Pseudomonas syringae pv. theae]MBL3833942.1 hypothetical protein [Pseudomonas syringae pv. theae]MBL3869468.1 hypothetical protein [Pseudomonas syringae pv. theae]MBL3874485.1 hypothetical protein [Pseudomonas syringae pv. theae]